MKSTSYQHHIWRNDLCMRPRPPFMLHHINSLEHFTLDGTIFRNALLNDMTATALKNIQ